MDNRVITIQRNNVKIEHRTANSMETEFFAKTFANTLRGGEVVALKGELGAGKTVFASGLAKGLGIAHAITSPTFVLMLLYPLSARAQKIFHAKNFCHIDTYRLSRPQELIDIGIEEYLGNPDTISVVEWPEKIKQMFLKNVIFIEIKSDH